MAFLDYLLGGVSGGFEGYERRKAKELQAQKDEEDRQIKQLAMLNQLGFRATGPVRQEADPAARNIVADISAEVPKPSFDTTMGRAFGAAQQRGFGVAEQPTSPLTSPVSLALDTTKNRQFERARGMQAANPETQMNVKGIGRIGFRSPETPEQIAQREYDNAMRLEQGKRDLSAKDAKTKAEAEAAAKQAKIQSLVDSGIERNLAVRAVELEAKYGDISETPSVAATKRGQDISAMTARERLAFDREKALADAGSAQDKKRMMQQNMSTMLPTILGAAKDINSWGEKEIRQLSPTAIAVLNQASLQGGYSAPLLAAAASQMTTPIDRRYLQYAASISDAVARASEVGVLTNQDVNRYRNQVLFVGGEEMGDKRFKVNNLKQWATWLATNKGMFSGEDVNRASLSLMPGETPEEAQQSRGWQPANRPGSRFEDRMRGGPVQQQPSGSAFGMPAPQRIGMTLEQEFPGSEAQIREARKDGYSEAEIRSFLSRGR